MSKETLETVVSFAELWGVILAAAGAVLLFVAVVANRPLKAILAVEVQHERHQAEAARLELQTRLAEAEALTSAAQRDVKNIEAEAERDRRDIAAANAAAAAANERAAEANKAAEQEQVQRLKLEAEIAPRRLSAEQQLHLRQRLHNFKFVGKRVAVTSYAMDAEGAILATQIVSALGGQLDVQSNVASIMPIGGFLMGVQVEGNDRAFVFELTSALRREAKLDVQPLIGEPSVPPPEGQRPFDANILVGVKPVKR